MGAHKVVGSFPTSYPLCCLRLLYNLFLLTLVKKKVPAFKHAGKDKLSCLCQRSSKLTTKITCNVFLLELVSGQYLINLAQTDLLQYFPSNAREWPMEELSFFLKETSSKDTRERHCVRGTVYFFFRNKHFSRNFEFYGILCYTLHS